MSKETVTVKETLLVSPEEILNKKFNLWLGLSFGNKWFTKENLAGLINFGLAHTKESLLILIPGRLQASNFKYFDGMSRAQALKKAFAEEEEKNFEVRQILQKISLADRKKIIVANYDEVLTPAFVRQREILMREFSKQNEFYRLAIEIAADMLKSRGRTFSKDRAESVALFVLQELPLFLNGAAKIGTKQKHTVILYPGLGKLDYLIVKIIKDHLFSDLRQKLKINEAIGIASIE